MHVLIGCDEAGYGPNLGPLVISATAWELPAAADSDCDLYALLSDAVCLALPKAAEPGPRRLAIADSKQLYQSGGPCQYLEEPVLVALESLGKPVARWRELWPAMAPDCQGDFEAEVWHVGYDRELPWHSRPDELEGLAARFHAAQQRCGVRLCGVRSEAVFPARFNELCQRLGSKGLLLSHCTLGLVAAMIAQLDAEQVTVLADKHGGRNRYAALLQAAFDDCWVEVRRESREESCYRIRQSGRTIDFFFRVGGEEALPTAWASLCSKYLRELAMEAFNHYWRQRVPELRRTAGYPTDALRFLADIEPALAREPIARDTLWRQR